MIDTLLTPNQRLLLREFRRFGTVGLVGFLVDTAVVYGLRELFGLYGAAWRPTSSRRRRPGD